VERLHGFGYCGFLVWRFNGAERLAAHANVIDPPSGHQLAIPQNFTSTIGQADPEASVLLMSYRQPAPPF
jgi:hypothetical protein